MAKKNVYQFKIALRGIKPMIWRKIQIPTTSTFYDLHLAIQEAMGWTDSHLHEFCAISPKYFEEERLGLPDDDNPFSDYNVRDDSKVKVKTYLVANKKFEYTYDFGDNWEHNITFEGEFPAQPELKYPRCISGKRACPPEDVGGTWGYERVVEILKSRDKLQKADPTAVELSEEDQDLIEWLNPDYDPEWFDPNETFFYENESAEV